MLFTVRPCPLCLPQPLLWPQRPGSGHGSHVGGGGSGQGSSRRSGGGGTGVNTAGASGGAGGGSGGAPASAGGGHSAAAAAGGSHSAAAAAGGGGSAAAATADCSQKLSLCQRTSDKEAFLCIRLRMTPQYSIDRSQRTVHNSWVTMHALHVNGFVQIPYMRAVHMLHAHLPIAF